MPTEKEVQQKLKDKLAKRQKQAVQTRGQRGLGKKSVLDFDRLEGTKPKTWKPTTGRDKNLIDILPFKVTQAWMKELRAPTGKALNHQIGDLEYKLELPVHRNVGEAGDSFVCLFEAFGKKCPLCEEMFEEYDKDKPDEKKIRALRSSWRDWFNIYDYDGEGDALEIWEDVSYHLFEKFVKEEAEIGEDVVLYSHPDEGKSVEFKGVEKSIGKNNFVEAQSIEFLDRDAYEFGIVEDTISFDALVILSTYDEVARAHFGLTEEETGGREESETETEPDDEPTKTRSRRRGRTEKKEEKQEEDIPPWVEGECPEGKAFGTDYNDTDECQNCPEEAFEACEREKERLDATAKEDKKEKSTTRTRTRSRRTRP